MDSFTGPDMPANHDAVISRLSGWLGRLPAVEPAGWDQLPDIGLYMDQVLTYIDRQLALYRSSEKEHVLTSAMVNNYIKDNLLPRADLKKYTPTHLALLTMIGTLKQVLSMQDLQILLNRGNGQLVQDAYGHFLEQLGASIAETTDAVKGELQRLVAVESQAPDQQDVEHQAADDQMASLRRIALDLAIEARVHVLIAERLLETVAASEREAREKKTLAEREVRERKATAEAADKGGRKK